MNCHARRAAAGFQTDNGGKVNSLFDCQCRLLITFASQTVWTQIRSGSKLFDTLMIFLKDYFGNVNFEEKNQQTTKKCEELITLHAKS